MPKLQSILFSAVDRIGTRFAGTRIRKVPGVRKAYHLLTELPWILLGRTVIEIQGSKMYINVREKDPGMRHTFRVYALHRVHEEATTALFKKVVKEGDVVLDLGANIGYFTLLAARLVGKKGRVYAFEPEPRNYSYLAKNIALNGYDNVVAVPKAVSNKPGKTKLYICPYDTGHHTIHQYGGIQAYKPGFIDNKKEFIEIEMVALDDFFQDKEQSVDVVKMDIEGAEMLALSGMDRVIKSSGNLKMFIEFFPLLIRQMGDSPEEFIRRLLEIYHFSLSIVGHDYSMADLALKEEYVKVESVDEVMNFCQGEMDHINLFLTKGAK